MQFTAYISFLSLSHSEFFSNLQFHVVFRFRSKKCFQNKSNDNDGDDDDDDDDDDDEEEEAAAKSD